MMREIKKIFVSNQIDIDGTYVVALLQEDDGSGKILYLQRFIGKGADHFPCYLVNEKGQEFREGGLLECVLRGNMLRLKLTADAAAAINESQTLELQLSVDKEEVEALRVGLETIFARDEHRPSILIIDPS